jgi:hypothetical protein
MMHRLLPLGPDHEPLWVRLYFQQIGERWAALLLANEEPPPEPRTLNGLAFFGATQEEAEHAAKVFLAMSEPEN